MGSSALFFRVAFPFTLVLVATSFSSLRLFPTPSFLADLSHSSNLVFLTAYSVSQSLRLVRNSSALQLSVQSAYVVLLVHFSLARVPRSHFLSLSVSCFWVPSLHMFRHWATRNYLSLIDEVYKEKIEINLYLRDWGKGIDGRAKGAIDGDQRGRSDKLVDAKSEGECERAGEGTTETALSIIRLYVM